MFRALSEGDLAQLAAVSRIGRYDKGELLFSENDPSELFFSIVSGRVKVFKMTPAGKDVILQIFGENDPIGAVAVYEERPYPASAMALEETTCIVIPRNALFGLLRQYPSLVRGLLVGLTHRLIELTSRIAELTGGRVEHRLARLFVKLADECGERCEEGVFIPLPLNRQELADLTGTTIETTIRIMSRWGKEGVLRTEAKGFTVVDRSTLEALALN